MSDKWLIGVFNSKLATSFYLNNFNIVRGAYIEFISQNMSKFPIPTPTPEQARALEGFTDDSRLPELNALVYELYGLNAGEIALVEELTAGAYGAAGGVETVEEEESVEA